MKTILHIISDSNIGGAGRSLLNYLRCADQSRFQSHVALPRRSALKEQLEELGVPIHEIDAMADKAAEAALSRSSVVNTPAFARFSYTSAPFFAVA